MQSNPLNIIEKAITECTAAAHISACEPASLRIGLDPLRVRDDGAQAQADALHISACEPASLRGSLDPLRGRDDGAQAQADALHISACEPASLRIGLDPLRVARPISLDIRRHNSLFFTNIAALTGIPPEYLAHYLESDASLPLSNATICGNLLYFDLSETVYDNILAYFTDFEPLPAPSPCPPDSESYQNYIISVILSTYAPQDGPLPPEDRPLCRLLLYCLHKGTASDGLLRELRLLSGKMLSSRAFSALTTPQHALLRAILSINRL